ncbi:MAG: PAS domain-containing protein [Kiritimatiellia bacterium]
MSGDQTPDRRGESRDRANPENVDALEALHASETRYRRLFQYLRSTLDGLSAHIAVVDEHGDIVLVNKSYREFGRRNGVEPDTVSEGTNYLAVCDNARGDHAGEARSFADGIREVLLGKRQYFEMEYPCHSPEEKRWFIGRVTSFEGEGPRRVIVAHENITERKRAEERRQEGFDLLHNLARLVPGVIYQYRLYPDGRSAFPYSSPGMYDIYEVTPEEVREDASVVFGRLHPEDRERVSESILESARTLNTFNCELRVILPGQGLRWRWSKAHPERTEDGGTLWHGIILDITERKRAEAKLAESEGILRDIVESTLSGFWDWNLVDNTEHLSPTFKRMFGYEDHEMESSPEAWQKLIFPEDLPGVLAVLDRHVRSHGREPFYNEIRCRHRNGSTVWVVSAGRVIEWSEEGTAIRMAGCHIDITKRKHAGAEREKLQAQLRQAQKMEAVGHLAGGVAHDFNNLLIGIMGYAELCRDRIAPDHPIRGYLDEITHDAGRSAEITRQLLAFARKQTIAPKILDLNDAVGGMLKLLRRLIGEDITLAWRPGAGMRRVNLDPAQVDQILANLCVNARDAIAGVGEIALETGSVVIDEAYCASHPEALPGSYVFLSVSDDGCGMDKETQARIFEPFFTTKGLGKGTGLGLSTVYGIVRQNNGFICANSEPGKGTTFKIYLPEIADEAKAPVSGRAETPGGREETVLLVEDEKSLCVTCSLFLKALDYNVLVAETPAEALKMVAGHPGEIHVLLTDVVMPGMDGRQLAQRVSAAKPGVKVVFMSGYTADVIAQRGVLDEGVQFLSKPFTRSDLARKIREVLEAD